MDCDEGSIQCSTIYMEGEVEACEGNKDEIEFKRLMQLTGRYESNTEKLKTFIGNKF